MTPTSAAPAAAPSGPHPIDRSALRRRSLANVLQVGHCAPTVMKTLLDATGADAPWAIRLAAGLPGGIGNTGNECGGITAPLVFLGLRHARAPDEDGVPVVVSKGRALLNAFESCHGTHACREILWHGRVPLRCFGVISHAAERCLDIDERPCAGALSPNERDACARLHAHFVAEDFHCAHAVLQHARGAEAVEPNVRDAMSAFVAGTAYAGLTCSALTAGVLLLGLSHGKCALGPARVLRAIAAMATGSRVFADDREAVERAMNEGNELATWFEGRFGSIRCSDLVGGDFSRVSEVERYVQSGGVVRCRGIAREVAERARRMLSTTVATDGPNRAAVVRPEHASTSSLFAFRSRGRASH
jgi:C_GCAxxG_C_C family probable redox protein